LNRAATDHREHASRNAGVFVGIPKRLVFGLFGLRLKIPLARERDSVFYWWRVAF
jgi:hypothetical protein